MNISSRCEYACRAVLELALVEKANEPLASVTIAHRRHIPEKYLVHILLQLKRAGLVNSVRGAQGGYKLGRPSEEITLLDIITAIDGPIMDPLPTEEPETEDLRDVWKNVASGIEKVLRRVTVRQIIDDAATTDMYYI
jgi:Rrf2 family protein